MNAIRVKTLITSETLRLPELKAMVGKYVEIIVLETTPEPSKRPVEKAAGRKNGKSWFDRSFGAGWPDSKDDGFEEAVDQWRRSDRPGALLN